MIIRIVLVGFTAFLAWIIHVANTGGSNFLLEVADAIPNGDKIGHFFIMGAFAYLVNLLMACKSFRLGSFSMLSGSVIVLIFVVLEEMTHMFIRTRTFSYMDLLSDVLGIIAFSILAVKTFPFIARISKETRRESPPGLDAPAS